MVFAVIRMRVSAEKQPGECVKLLCVAEITPEPYQLHRGS